MLMGLSLWVWCACASLNEPKIAQPQFSQWHYSFTVFLDPQQLHNSPRLDLALSLLRMHYPLEQSMLLREILYAGDDFEQYQDRILRQQRENFRSRQTVMDDEGQVHNWRYLEDIYVMSLEPQGMIITRQIESFSGGAHPQHILRYFVVDLDKLKLVNIDDLFLDYQGEETRDLIYDELRNYSGLSENQPLSEGIFLSDEPELSFNFYFTEIGLCLVWDPYAITPHSEGGVNIIVPWWRVRPLLLQSGMELLTKFNINLFI